MSQITVPPILTAATAYTSSYAREVKILRTLSPNTHLVHVPAGFHVVLIPTGVTRPHGSHIGSHGSNAYTIQVSKSQSHPGHPSQHLSIAAATSRNTGLGSRSGEKDSQTEKDCSGIQGLVDQTANLNLMQDQWTQETNAILFGLARSPGHFNCYQGTCDIFEYVVEPCPDQLTFNAPVGLETQSQHQQSQASQPTITPAVDSTLNSTGTGDI
ncbi:hypothetical protein HK102_008543, partial [Quaeritorhiza haematococci]